jgi:hypothetical protein
MLIKRLFEVSKLASINGMMEYWKVGMMVGKKDNI